MDAAFFVTDEIHKREVTLADGKNHVFHFKEAVATEFRKYYKAEKSDDPDISGNSMALLIAATLCEPDGTPAITYAQATKLKMPVMTAIFSAILDINGLNATKKDSPSSIPTASGT